MQKLGVQPEQIRELCEQAHVIKAMFVAIVNNTVSTVKRWDFLSVCHHYLSRDLGKYSIAPGAIQDIKKTSVPISP